MLFVSLVWNTAGIGGGEGGSTTPRSRRPRMIDDRLMREERNAGTMRYCCIRLGSQGSLPSPANTRLQLHLAVLLLGALVLHFPSSISSQSAQSKERRLPQLNQQLLRRGEQKQRNIKSGIKMEGEIRQQENNTNKYSSRTGNSKGAFRSRSAPTWQGGS